ncbi:MAG: thioredoxin family protein [Armatimonadetes bacterium]|nr:thioredoxin family protein [Armatimonadota bacterium]MDW8154787.1 thioredoxin family protein [Armatimonadota bacterium]
MGLAEPGYNGAVSGRPLRITLLYWEGCPSHEEALARVRRILAEEGVEAEVTVFRVHTEEEARRWRFVGSPTILVEGEDIQPSPEEPYRLTCRIYRWEDGRVSPLPSPETLRRAVRAALERASRR